MDRWTGRVALVTGASSGIGAAICKQLVQSGMKVIGTARGVERIEELAKGLSNHPGSLTAVKCDVTKDDDIYSLFDTIKKIHGGVDICINNAGISYDKSLLDGSPNEWRHMVDVNVIAVCLCTKLAVASMRERSIDDGHIINISSRLGHMIPSLPAVHFYSASKFALRAITEGLRQELREAKSHIRASSVSPGVVETEFFQRTYNDENAKKRYLALKCLEAEDVASTVLHVISSPPHVEINDVLVVPTEQTW